jgi:hypothetical protein
MKQGNNSLKVILKDNGYRGDNHNSGADCAVSVNDFRSKPYAEPKTTGIKIRGTGAATKGVTARGPMG